MQRSSLAAAVQAKPESAEAWWAFLANEEAIGGTCTGSLSSALKASRNAVTLFSLFTLATQTVPRKGNYDNKAYLSLWLGYARHQW